MADGWEQQVVLGAEGACWVAEKDTGTGSTKIMTGTHGQGDRRTDRREREGGELTLRKETT